MATVAHRHASQRGLGPPALWLDGTLGDREPTGARVLLPNPGFMEPSTKRPTYYLHTSRVLFVPVCCRPCLTASPPYRLPPCRLQIFVFVFLPPFLLDLSVRVDYFLLKKVRAWWLALSVVVGGSGWGGGWVVSNVGHWATGGRPCRRCDTAYTGATRSGTAPNAVGRHCCLPLLSLLPSHLNPNPNPPQTQMI